MNILSTSLIAVLAVHSSGSAAPSLSVHTKPGPALQGRTATLASLPIINPSLMLQMTASMKASADGDHFVTSGDWAQAANSYQEAVQDWPGNTDAFYGLARCAAAAGDTLSEIKYYRAAIYAHNPSEYGTIPEDGYRENNVSKLMEYVLLLSRTRQEQEALSVYRRAVDLLNYDHGKPNIKVFLPDFGPGQTSYTLQRLQAMAHVAIAIETSDDTEKSSRLAEAIRLCPNSAVAYFYLGECLSRFGGDRSKAAYEQAAQLDDGLVNAAAKKALRQTR